MKKQTILITGGAQRIGKAIALSLKNNNLNFVIHYNNSIEVNFARFVFFLFLFQNYL